MSGSKRSTFKAGELLIAILAGAVISGASVIAYINSGQEMPIAANIVVSMFALAAMPGYIVSAYITNNVHAANLILAGGINFILYGGLSLWLLSRRRRRRSVARPDGDR